ncbi:MAG: hypothetical protein K0U98_15830 [Deltaproteobacteria bacterium]|nr:hypothetical protein [Deltaproteobacteria bacterium]
MKLNLAVVMSLAALALLIVPATVSAQDSPPTTDEVIATDSADTSCSSKIQATANPTILELATVGYEQEPLIDLSFLSGPRDSHQVDFADGATTTGIRFGWGVCVDSCLPCHRNFPCGPGQGKCYYGGHCP